VSSPFPLRSVELLAIASLGPHSQVPVAHKALPSTVSPQTERPILPFPPGGHPSQHAVTTRTMLSPLSPFAEHSPSNSILAMGKFPQLTPAVARRHSRPHSAPAASPPPAPPSAPARPTTMRPYAPSVSRPASAPAELTAAGYPRRRRATSQPARVDSAVLPPSSSSSAPGCLRSPPNAAASVRLGDGSPWRWTRGLWVRVEGESSSAGPVRGDGDGSGVSGEASRVGIGKEHGEVGRCPGGRFVEGGSASEPGPELLGGESGGVGLHHPAPQLPGRPQPMPAWVRHGNAIPTSHLGAHDAEARPSQPLTSSLGQGRGEAGLHTSRAASQASTLVASPSPVPLSQCQTGSPPGSSSPPPLSPGPSPPEGTSPPQPETPPAPAASPAWAQRARSPPRPGSRSAQRSPSPTWVDEPPLSPSPPP
jgi:hypothetical protein